jgi:hypothetical protein
MRESAVIANGKGEFIDTFLQGSSIVAETNEGEVLVRT